MNAPDTTTSEPAPSAWADGYREAIRDAAAACCGAIARIVTPPPRTQAETDVLAERAKQRAKWGNDHDDKHEDGVLGLAAGYLAGSNGILHPDPDSDDPWDAPKWVRDIADNVRKDRRRELVIASALLLAEIERLDRAGGE